MGRDYIPESDTGAADWMRAFAQNISAMPQAYALSPADAAAIDAAVQEYLQAMRVSSEELTRTKVSVRRKNEARLAAQQLCRHHAALIKHNLEIDDGLKIAIGVPRLRLARSPRNVPASSPLLKIIGATPGMHELRYSDTSTPTSRAMPFAATHLQLFAAIDEAPVHEISSAKFCGNFTKNPMRVQHESQDAGNVATYWARWASQRGKFGPWSLPASMTIAA